MAQWILNISLSLPLKFHSVLVKKESESRSVGSDSLRPHGLQSMGFSRPEYWSEQLFSSPGDLPNSGMKLGSPALQAHSSHVEPPGKPKNNGVGSLSLL